MLEKRGDLWEARQPGDWVVITTNATLRRDGLLVMGRGIALEASQRYKYLQATLGSLIKENGQRVEVIDNLDTSKIIAFPVKNHFKDKADINIILKSTLQLLDAAQRIEGRILMPRPGAGYGRLDWLEVRPMLMHYLVDNRFVVFNK